MSIKQDPPDENWRTPGSSQPEKKVDGRTREGRAAKSASQQARESEAQARAEREATALEQGRQISAAIGNRNEEQLARRNAIADNFDKTPDRVMLETDGETILEPQVTDGERAAQIAQEEAEAEQQRQEAEANERAARREQEAGAVRAEPKKYKLKVNGKEVELTEQEVLERASKVSSADEYLQTASEAVQRAQALGSPKDGSASVVEDDIEDTLTSALQGDSEAIKKVAQRLKAPSTRDVLQAVDDRMSFRSAVDWFKGEYKDVVSDPMLYRLVVDEDTKLAKTEPLLSFQDRLRRAGDHVRDWKKSLMPTPPANPKLERKASVAPVPAASGRQVAREEEDEEESVEVTIDKIARTRGQGGAIRKN